MAIDVASSIGVDCLPAGMPTVVILPAGQLQMRLRHCNIAGSPIPKFSADFALALLGAMPPQVVFEDEGRSFQVRGLVPVTKLLVDSVPAHAAIGCLQVETGSLAADFEALALLGRLVDDGMLVRWLCSPAGRKAMGNEEPPTSRSLAATLGVSRETARKQLIAIGATGTARGDGD